MLKNARRLGMPESKKPIVSEKLLKRLKKARKTHINLYFITSAIILQVIYDENSYNAFIFTIQDFLQLTSHAI